MGEVHSIDVRGYSCPYPVYYTLMEAEKLSPGERLEVLLDNPPSCEEIPIVVRKRGYKVLNVIKVEETLWKISIER